jgi:aryl-alcohol dehydrogenase-like predicted oxidoreductase
MTVAIAYVMHKTRFVFPIIGGRKVEHLQDNVKALDVALTKEHIDFLESILPFDKGFPTALFVSLNSFSVVVVNPD